MDPEIDKSPHFTTPDLTEPLLNKLEQTRQEFEYLQYPYLVIHNGDREVPHETLHRLKFFYGHIYAVNLPESFYEEDGFTQVPIGLENFHWHRNGDLGYFPDGMSERPKGTVNGVNKRLLMANFQTSTNPEVREPLRKKLQTLTGIWQDPTSDLGSYFESIRNALFVISPEGNGKDCHRTWEAIYLGAIPIIKEKLLSPSLTDSLPILVVRDWDEVLELEELELRALAEEISFKSPTAAYMPYWTARLEKMFA